MSKSFVSWFFGEKGGPGSGNFDHAGRPGEVGGSAPEGGGLSAANYSVPKSAKPMPNGKRASFTAEDGGLLFHGTSAPNNVKYMDGDSDGVIYLTDDYNEAVGYAKGVHFGGGGGKGTQRVMEIAVTPGKVADISAEVDEAISAGGDDDFGAIFKKARDAGFSYAYFTHPSNHYDDRDQRVIVSLNPGADLGSFWMGWDIDKNRRFQREKAFYGHAGRPGLVGGSVPSSQAMSRSTGAAAVARMRGKPGSVIDANNPPAPAGEPKKASASAFGGGKAPTDPIYLNVDNDFGDGLKHKAVKYFLAGDPGHFYTDEGRMKDNVVNELSDRAGDFVSYEDANDFIKNWARSANDTDIRALNIQKDAAEELGIELSDWQKGRIEHCVDRLYMDPEQRLMPEYAQKKLIREMYNLTQERLKELGYDPEGTIRLYRGFGSDDPLKFKPGDVVDYVGNAIESWSLKPSQARNFEVLYNDKKYGARFVIEVPLKSIVGSYFSGFGCMDEAEFIIGGLSGAGNEVQVVSLKL